MEELVLGVLLLILTATFLAGAMLLRRTRLSLESKNTKNTVSMFHVRDMVHGRVKKFRR